MKMTNFISLSLLLSLAVFCCFQTTLAQSGPIEITAADIEKYIGKTKSAGDKWGAIEEQYVLENFNRPQLIRTINNWQARNTLKLSKEVEIRVIVDYLLTELHSMRALNPLLDSVAKGEPSSFGKQLKAQVSSTAFTQYQLAKVQIDINIPVVDVVIDGDSMGPTANQAVFSITADSAHIVLMTKSGSAPCAKAVSAGAGKIVVANCTITSP